MSRVVLFFCLLVLVSAAVALDLPGGVPKVPDPSKVPDLPKLPDTGLPNAKTFADLDDDK